MLATTDFVNVMTYDLHGTWDGKDPWIGSYVLAHTNLTEIKTTLQLFQNVFTSADQWTQVRIHAK
jgi:GH18 family chitinase